MELRRKLGDPVGLPDFCLPTKTDLVAQTIDKIRTDIVAQSVGNIKTDIAAQSVGNLGVDIRAQSLGNIGVDLRAQTIQKLNMDIYAQTISEVNIWAKHGVHQTISTGGPVPAGGSATFLTVTGTGIVEWFLGWVKANTNSHLTYIAIIADGTPVSPYWSFSQLNDFGFGPTTPWVQLLKYAADGFCVLALTPPFGLKYNNSFKVQAINPTGIEQQLYGVVNYTVL
jgi:hypothetical protein